MRIAFILHEFPVISQSLILKQITGLIDRGHEVDVYAQAGPDGSGVHEDFTAYGLRKRTFYLPRLSGTRLRLAATGLWLIASHYHRDPRTLLRALRVRHLAHGLPSIVRLISSAIIYACVTLVLFLLAGRVTLRSPLAPLRAFFAVRCSRAADNSSEPA